jgi:hypothetical protein
MITAEDYNIAPLTAGTDILKVKSVNRLASGISKYYELSDVTGKYSTTNIYGSDGALYKDEVEHTFDFSFNSRNEIYSVLINQVSPILNQNALKNFYFDKFPRPTLEDPGVVWVQLTNTTNQTTGYFKSRYSSMVTPLQTGYYSGSNLSYVTPGALVKFVPPSGKYFSTKGKLVSVKDSTTTDFIWVKVVNTIGDGTNGGTGALSDGTGPVILSNYIPNTAIASTIIPAFDTSLSSALQSEIINLCLANRNFGLSFDAETRNWYIVNDTDIKLSGAFSLVDQKDTTNTNADASWLLAFTWNGIGYNVRYRISEYLFESKQETAFFFDGDNRNYDFVTGTIIKDKVTVLSINHLSTSTAYGLGKDYEWQVDNNVVEADGYVNPKRIKVSFFDALSDGAIDNPDAFDTIVTPDTTNSQTAYKDKFVYFKLGSNNIYSLTDPGQFLAYPTDTDIPESELVEGQLYYLYESSYDYVAKYSTSTGVYFTVQPEYYAKPGRQTLKFHYVHNSSDNKRIDPSKTNLIDIYLLSASYDIAYRSWLTTGAGTEPLPPTSSSLEENYASVLEPIKAISDQLVFQPVKYKVLFGTTADRNLQATFKAVRNSSRSVSDNDIRARILSAIQEFFSLDNWDFGQTFYFSELTTYVMNLLSPDITNFIIVPKADIPFGSLYEITSQNNEIFVSGVTANEIEVINSITSSQIKTTATIINSSVGVA